jgi:predicted NACHT family NTPase
MLAEIAYQGFAKDQLFFQKQQLVDSIKDFLADTVDNPKYLDGKKILNAIAAQQGILVERAADIYSFSHLTLQEYLTAQFISQKDSRIEDLVNKHLTEKRWREVFLLVAGLKDDGNSNWAVYQYS